MGRMYKSPEDHIQIKVQGVALLSGEELAQCAAYIPEPRHEVPSACVETALRPALRLETERISGTDVLVPGDRVRIHHQPFTYISNRLLLLDRYLQLGPDESMDGWFDATIRPYVIYGSVMENPQAFIQPCRPRTVYFNAYTRSEDETVAGIQSITGLDEAQIRQIMQTPDTVLVSGYSETSAWQIVAALAAVGVIAYCD